MSKTILVVDDSRTVRKQVGASLAAGGYQILEAESGEEGVEKIAGAPEIAMVICDVNMPRMDGIEMVSLVRADPSKANLPIVMLTTEGRVDVIERAKKAGAKGWIVKPFKPEQLLAMVQRVVG